MSYVRMSYVRMFYNRMFYNRKPISPVSSRTPASRVEGPAVVAAGYKQLLPRASPSFAMTVFSRPEILNRR